MENKEIEILEPIDFSVLLAEYSKMWVVLSFDETKVIKAGKTYDEIRDFAEKGIAMLVPDYDYPFAPYSIK